MEAGLRKFIFLIFIFLAHYAKAQDIQQRLFWLSVQGEFKLKENRFFIAEFHQRTFFQNLITHQNAIRLHYRLSWKRLDASIGLSYFRSEPGDPERRSRPVTAEIRPHIDIIVPMKIGQWRIESRWRNELRYFNREDQWSDFIQTNTLRSWRSRWRAQLISPMKSTMLGTFRGRIGYELFVQKNLQDGNWDLEHQRFLTGINRVLSDRFSAELGVIYWRQPLPSNINLHRLILFLNFYFE